MTGEAARVLVVDDHELNLKLLQRVLELDGHDVLAASSLGAADEVLARQLPALIVLDLQLPDGDGLDLARRLKAMPETAPCPILACTADAMQGDGSARSRPAATRTCRSRSTRASSPRSSTSCSGERSPHRRPEPAE